MTDEEARHYRKVMDLYAREHGLRVIDQEDAVIWGLQEKLLPFDQAAAGRLAERWAAAETSDRTRPARRVNAEPA
jgi:hypothetical protein